MGFHISEQLRLDHESDFAAQLCARRPHSSWRSRCVCTSGWPPFAPVRLWFGGGTVRAIPVFDSAVPVGFAVFQYSLKERDGSGS